MECKLHLVALHMTGGVPEDRHDLIRLATGESFVRPDCLPESAPGSECTGSDCSGCATGFDDWPSED